MYMSMKLLIYLHCLCLATVLSAQGKKSLPEPSEPPFEVGALPLQSGYTIVRDGAPDLNFRFVNNEIRLYWLDDDGLIVKPEVETAIVRFTGSVRGRDYHQLRQLSGDVGLGSPINMLPPHLYNVILVFPIPDSEESLSFRFRYTPSMDEVASPDSK